MIRIMTLVSSVILSIGIVFLFIKLRRLENTVRLVEKSSKVQLSDEDVNTIVNSAITNKIPQNSDNESRVKALEDNINKYMQNVHTRIEYEISELNKHKHVNQSATETVSVEEEQQQQQPETEAVVPDSEPEPNTQDANDKPKPKTKRSKRNPTTKKKTSSSSRRVTRSRAKKTENNPEEDCIVITDLKVEE